MVFTSISPRIFVDHTENAPSLLESCPASVNGKRHRPGFQGVKPECGFQNLPDRQQVFDGSLRADIAGLMVSSTLQHRKTRKRREYRRQFQLKTGMKPAETETFAFQLPCRRRIVTKQFRRANLAAERRQVNVENMRTR